MLIGRPELVTEMLQRLRPDNLRVTILTKNAKYLETKVSVLIDILIPVTH